MAELTAQAVEDYTQGRLEAGDSETNRLLSAALGAARRYCGWHVTPPRTEEIITLDGTGTQLLAAPTLKISTITDITENGIDVDPDDVVESAKAPGHLYKKSGACWARGFSAITLKITHGYDDAPAWQAAVLSLVDRWSYLPTGGEPTVIGPFQYPTREQAGEAFTATERYILDMYALESPA